MFSLTPIEFVASAIISIVIFFFLYITWLVVTAAIAVSKIGKMPVPGYEERGSYKWDPKAIIKASGGTSKLYVMTLSDDAVYYIGTDAEHAALNLRDNSHLGIKCYVIEFNKDDRLNEAWTHDSPEVLEINDYRSYLLS